MSRSRQLTGRAKSRYLHGLLEDGGDARSIIAKADAEIAQIIVSRAAAERPRRMRSLRQAQRAADDSSVTSTVASSDDAHNPTSAAAPSDSTTRDSAVPAAPFNPYGFSAMAVLLSEGRAALEARLEGATTREQIAQLAAAQSIRLEPKLLANPKTGMAKLRAAFVEAVEKRVAHRRAVAG